MCITTVNGTLMPRFHKEGPSYAVQIQGTNAESVPSDFTTTIKRKNK